MRVSQPKWLEDDPVTKMHSLLRQAAHGEEVRREGARVTVEYDQELWERLLPYRNTSMFRSPEPWEKTLLRFGMRSCFYQTRVHRWLSQIIGYDRFSDAEWWWERHVLHRFLGSWWSWFVRHPIRYSVILVLGWMDRLPRCGVCGAQINSIWGHPPAAQPDWYCNVQCSGAADTPMNRRLKELVASGELVEVHARQEET